MAWQCLELEVAAEFGAISSAARYEADLVLRRIMHEHSQRAIEIQAAHRSMGLCWCGKARAPGLRRCQMCTDRRRARFKSLAAAGKCGHCGGARDSELRVCRRCSDLDRSYRQQRLAAGLCRCGRQRSAPGRMCAVCIDRTRATVARNVEAGLCRCGKARVAGQRQCATCVAKHQRAHVKRTAARAARRKAAP